MIFEFFCQRVAIFSDGNFQNIVTGEILDTPTKEFLVNCLKSSETIELC